MGLAGRIALWGTPDLTSDTVKTARALGIETVCLFSQWKSALTLAAGVPDMQVMLVVGDAGISGLEESLRRALALLGRSRVQGLLLFYPQLETFTDPSILSFLREQRDSTAESVGLMARDEGTALLTHSLQLDLACVHHNWFRREQALELFPVARSQGLPIVAAEVLRGSRLDSPQVAQLHGHFPGISLGRLALGYALHESAVRLAGLDASSPEQLESCFPPAELSPEQMETIDRVLMGLPAR